MFVHRKSGVIRVVREAQFDLPVSQPLLTLLSTTKEALLSIDISEEQIRRTSRTEELASIYRFTAVVYPDKIIGLVGSWDEVRNCPEVEAINPAPLSYRWVAWLDADDEDEFLDYGENVCFTGFCQKEQLGDLSNKYLVPDCTFLAFPVFEPVPTPALDQAIANEWEADFEQWLTCQ
jgi:hypothetical protein